MGIVIPEKYRILDAAVLKRLAIIAMLIDHFAASVLYIGIIKPNSPALPGTWVWYLSRFYKVLRGVGRFAFPIFCFFMVEAFFYTHSRAKYLLRLVLFGLITELPFDLALARRFVNKNHQNVMFELAMGFAMIWVFDLIGRLPIKDFMVKLCLQYLSAVPFILLARYFALDYRHKGLMLILLLFVTHSDRYLQCIAGAIFTTLWEWPAFLSYLALLLYNGERGRQNKYFFYCFYPGHLLILFLITHFLLGIPLIR